MDRTSHPLDFVVTHINAFRFVQGFIQFPLKFLFQLITVNSVMVVVYPANVWTKQFDRQIQVSVEIIIVWTKLDLQDQHFLSNTQWKHFVLWYFNLNRLKDCFIKNFLFNAQFELCMSFYNNCVDKKNSTNNLTLTFKPIIQIYKIVLNYKLIKLFSWYELRFKSNIDSWLRLLFLNCRRWKTIFQREPKNTTIKYQTFSSM